MITDNEFSKAYAELCESPHHCEPDHWDKIHEEQKKHPKVGCKAIIEGERGIWTCVEGRADWKWFKFKKPGWAGDLLIFGKELDKIVWL